MSQLIAMFCDIDDFCKVFEPFYTQRLLQKRPAPTRSTESIKKLGVKPPEALPSRTPPLRPRGSEG